MPKLVKQFATFLPKREAATITELAQSDDRSAAYIVRQLLTEALDRRSRPEQPEAEADRG